MTLLLNSVPLGEAHADIGPRPLGRFGDSLELLVLRHHRGIVVPLPVHPAFLRPLPQGEAEVEPDGIAGDEQLRKDDEVGLVGRGFVNGAEDLVQRSLLVEHHGLGLDGR